MILIDSNFKLFLPIKNNIGIDKGGYRYKICIKVVKYEEQELETCHIEWSKDKVNISANEAANYERPSPKREEAKEFLRDCLKNGSMLVRDVRQKSEELGISQSVLYAAIKELGVIQDETNAATFVEDLVFTFYIILTIRTSGQTDKCSDL